MEQSHCYRDHQAFVEASGVALWACPPKTSGAVMCPLQLLTGNVLLAAILGMSAATQLQAVAGRELMPAASIPSVSEMAAPLMGAKWQHHSFDQGTSTPRQEETAELDDTPEEPPHQKWKEGRSAVSPLKENHWEVFSKRVRTHQSGQMSLLQDPPANYKHEGSYNLFYFQGNGHLC